MNGKRHPQKVGAEKQGPLDGKPSGGQTRQTDVHYPTTPASAQAEQRRQLGKKEVKALLSQKQKRRPQTSDMYALGANLPRKNKVHTRDSWHTWELLVIMGSVISLLYIWLFSQSFHFHVAHLYAHFGYPSAQHIVGQRYLKGAGVVKDEEMAMHWFRQASQQDHPHASFNLAVGKLKNMTGSMAVGDVEMLLNVAARQGIQEAQELLENVIGTKSKLLPTKRTGSFYKH
ncbi:uncharacterized protein LOC116156332 [Camelus dromedarius]